MVDEEAGDERGALDDERDRALSVGRVCGIRDVEQVLVRQLTPDLAEDGKAADPGVEHADRRIYFALAFSSARTALSMLRIALFPS